MTAKTQDPERQALVYSILATAGFSLLGIIWGFAIGSQMILFDGSSWAAAVPYIDPAMVLLTCVLFVLPPVQMVRSTVHELLEGAPDPEVQAPVLAVIEDVRREFNLADPVIRLNKVGSKLYVEIDAFVAPGVTVAEEHAIRTLLEQRLKVLPYQVWLNLDLLPMPHSSDIASRAEPDRS